MLAIRGRVGDRKAVGGCKDFGSGNLKEFFVAKSIGNVDGPFSSQIEKQRKGPSIPKYMIDFGPFLVLRNFEFNFFHAANARWEITLGEQQQETRIGMV